MRVLGIALSCAILAGCVSLDPYHQRPARQHLQTDDAPGECMRLFQASDARIEAAATRDAQAFRVPGFPYLRVDRTLAQLAEAVAAEPQYADEWRAALAALDDAGRRFEMGNAGDPVDANALAVCRQQLLRADRQQLPALLAAAQVPDDYSSTQRALGLYLLTRYAFAAGIRGWQRDTLAEFADTDTGTARPAPLRYLPAARFDAVPSLLTAPQLGLPVISRSALTALILRHAPRLAIETADDNDRPGALVWQQDAGAPIIGVALDQPVLYVRAAYARVGGRWLLQLIYSAWFPARPPEQAFDLLAGRLDGLFWRVTLAEDGEALVYDSIHPCGCYHLFFPTERMRARPQPETIDEGLFVPQSLRSPTASQRVVLRLATRTHYLHGVGLEPAGRVEGVVMALRGDDQLRALPLPGGGTRSAFDPEGLIAGSERLERFYFWPMGIASPGQMRQWGRHATAFVGRRHFDDPTLIDRYFERLP